MQREEILRYGCQAMEEAVQQPGGLGVQRNWYHYIAGATMRDIDKYGSITQLMDFMLNIVKGAFDGLHDLERIEIYSEHIAHLRAATQREKREKGLNVIWAEKKQVLMGIQVTIPMDGIIDAVKLPDGEVIRSPYRDGDGHNQIVNSEEASRYLGQTGTIIGVSFQQRDIQMGDGAVVILIVADKEGSTMKSRES